MWYGLPKGRYTPGIDMVIVMLLTADTVVLDQFEAIIPSENIVSKTTVQFQGQKYNYI